MRTNIAARSTRSSANYVPPHMVSFTPDQELRRAVLSCMLGEDQFYESGEDITARIERLVGKVSLESATNLAVQARTLYHLRHTPLLLLLGIVKHHKGRRVGDAINAVIQRPDELTELLALYFKDGKRPLSSQLKQGLARAMNKFNEFQFSKYNRNSDVIKLRDVMRLVHPKPKTTKQNTIFEMIKNDTLPTVDTWEVALSSGADKRETWIRLMQEKRLGGFAFIRNLRNMTQVGVPARLMLEYSQTTNVDRILPFRYLAARRAEPSCATMLEAMMLRSFDTLERNYLYGNTLILVDVSVSMNDKLSAKSDMTRMDAASALAILTKEICHKCDVWTFSNRVVKMNESLRGFNLDRSIMAQDHGGTDLAEALSRIPKATYDRIIVITDEQSQTRADEQLDARHIYVINVGSYQNGLDYGDNRIVRLNGFSENVIHYIKEYENFIKEVTDVPDTRETSRAA